MPGGRLTQQERRRIALGLAEGLSYAEIARRLDRPTSTITREVMRNGGPNAYRATLAHRATERRARRRSTAALRAPTATPQTHGRDVEAVRDYQELLVAALVRGGLPNMSARVLTCLLVSDGGSLTAAELVQRLRVSPASVFKAVEHLDGQGVVRRERDERRERYVADVDAWYESMLAGARDSARFAETARQGVGILGPDSSAATRLREIAGFADFVSASLTRAAEQARAIVRPDHRATVPAGLAVTVTDGRRERRTGERPDAVRGAIGRSDR
ncbi:helix-turn-helix domain-containing protein [Kitasatospora purpeofusca]|uniref:helix-turn-helix domain-containing protein n=1 Tax=Kitasatospora purpeofusca TaxID=67352 RepID=UPI002A5AD96E|nr:helix-turn-helix domain-containing protein [Kitasatospora purpeofusca]MDY0812592.1 helix-turn-helix domain-containing protein [Kitasatospora purpeofusca]